MKRLVALSLVLIAAIAPLQAQVIRHRDGNWWRTQTQTEKASYTTGLFDGMTLGRNFSYWGLPRDQIKVPIASFDSLAKVYLDKVTNTQLVDGLDSFYDDYRNRSIALEDGVWLVMNSISGKSQGEMDKLIENYRKNAKP